MKTRLLFYLAVFILALGVKNAAASPGAVNGVLSSNANLSKLTISSGALTPVFATATTSYTASAANTVTAITVTPTTSDPTATVTVNGTAVTSGTASASISLSVGQNTITTVVTAQDGVTTKTYTVTVTRAPSTDARLSSIKLTPASTLTIVTGPSYANYTTTVAATTSSVTVTAIEQDLTATMTVNGVTTASGVASASIPLVTGSNVINVVSTAQDGVTTKTYTITATKTANTGLSALKLSSGTLTPTFAAATTSYTASVTNATTSITITPTAGDATGTITVNGTAVTSGAASGAIPLAVGANTITTIVTDGASTKTYTVTVTRAKSSDALLSSIKLSPASTLTLVTGPSYANYTTTVATTTSSITVTAIEQDATATMTVNGVTTASGVASASIPLAFGTNVINIVSTAQDGVTSKTYTITATRPTVNTGLSALTISSGTLTPVFSTAITSYTASVTITTSTIMVTPTSGDATSTITVNGTAVTSGAASGAIPLAVGPNTITTIVTDGASTKTYTVTVTRAKSTDALLSSIKLTPASTLTIVTGPSYANYTTTVAATTSSVTVTAIEQDLTATMTVNGVTTASGTASASIPLAVGSNTINIVSTAQDGVTIKTYTITVTRSAVATTFTWTGSGANPNWSNNNNWSPSSGYPIAGDMAIIGTTVNMPTIDVPSACSSLSITGATTITLAAALTVSGGATLNAALTVSGGAGSFTANSLTVNAGGGLTNSGAFTVNNGDISLAASTYINNLNGGTFNATGPPLINMLNNATITNAGIFNISGAAVQMGNAGFIKNATGGTFTINGGSSIDFAVNSATSGYLLNNGTFYAGTSNSACTINLNYAGVFLQNSSTFYLGSTSVINLTGASTSVQNTGTFTLQSDINGCAAIGNISGTSAVCTGIYNVQRYITGGSSLYRGYRVLSSPVNAGTAGGNTVYSLNYVKLTSYITGTTGTAGGFDNTDSGNPTLYLFRENIATSNASFTSGNYRGINDITAAPTYSLDVDGSGFNIPVGDGFFFFYRGDRSVASFATETTTTYVPTSATLTATGTLNQGQVTAIDWYTPTSPNLGFTNTAGNSTVQGFNLVGNPYASAIDWDTYNSSSTTTGIYANNMSPFIYVLDPVSKSYNVYATGTGGVGTIAHTNSNILPSGQGFFVIASNASAQLIFNESAKTNTQANAANGNLFLGAKPLTAVNQYLHLKLSQDANNIDGLLINFNDNAKPGYSLTEDALYKPGNGPVSLSSMSADNVALAINSMPLPKLIPTAIGLNVSAGADGVYQLNMDAIKSIPDLYDIWLMDAYKKDSLDIKHNPTYSFNIYKGDAASFGSKRFSLVIRQDPALMVHLLNFTATKALDGVQVVWKTENEQNYTNFTVERSTDNGATFNVLGGFASAALGTYSFADKDPLAADQYRLKLQDLNGAISYSNVVTLVYGNSANAVANNISVYPNPASGVINLDINQNGGNSLYTNLPALQNLSIAPGLVSTQKTAVAQSYSIKIISITGSVIKTSTSSQIAWQGNVSNLTPGTYIIQVTNNADNRLVGKSTFVKL